MTSTNQPRALSVRYEELINRIQQFYERNERYFFTEKGQLEPSFATLNSLLTSLKGKVERNELEREDVKQLARTLSTVRSMVQEKKQKEALKNFITSSMFAKSSQFPPRMDVEEAFFNARLVKALADPFRLLIMSILVRHEGDVSVFQIVESFDRQQPTISHHLRILRDAGLVTCEKRGLWAYYYVNREMLARAREIVEHLLDENQEDRQLLPIEAQVLQLVEAGLSTRDIAQELVSDEDTIQAYIQSAFRKLNVYKQIEAVTSVEP